jgi:hypothetical protein
MRHAGTAQHNSIAGSLYCASKKFGIFGQNQIPCFCLFFRVKPIVFIIAVLAGSAAQ